jgi:GNAT superfamily N-acetyltransferase
MSAGHAGLNFAPQAGAPAYHGRVAHLFARDESVPVGRTALSQLEPGDAQDMPWLNAALAPEWSIKDLEVAKTLSEAVLISDREGVPIGLALVRREAPSPGEATITFLAVQPERRFRGLGGEAGLGLERLVRERLQARRVYAGVPEGRGLAVYFWLRLGFRPLISGETPEAPVGLAGESLPGIWMVRESGAPWRRRPVY